MGRRHYYKMGSFYRIDDRTGFCVPAEDTRKEWTGNIVRTRSWEPRQPQDFVRGTVDQQNVPDPRPRTPPQFVQIGVTSLTTAANDSIGGGATIQVSNDANWLVNDVIWIMQDNGQYFRTLVTAIDGLLVSIDPPIVLDAESGNAVVNQALQARIVANYYPGMIGNFMIGRDSIGENSLFEFGPQLEPYPDEVTGDFGPDFGGDFSR